MNQGTGYWVETSDGSREYFVAPDARGDYRFNRCSCPDYEARGGPCKHAIAVRRLLLACERAEARQAAIALPEPALDLDAPISYELTPQAVAALGGEPVPAA